MARKHIKLPHLSEQDIFRFKNKINTQQGQGPKGDCWEWQAGRERGGYGFFTVKRRNKHPASRYAYLIFYHLDPADLCVLHHCDNPPCVNPKHLFLGTYSDNAKDRDTKGRWRNGAEAYFANPANRLRNAGENHKKAKLTDDAVRSIRARYINRKVSCAKLAAQYNVDASLVWLVVNHKVWKHIK